MGAAAGPIAAVSAVASLGMGAASTMGKAAGEQAANEAQAARLERAAQYGRTAAQQVDAQGIENLNAQLDNIDVVRAAQGADPSSPTTQALLDRTEYIGNRARRTQVGNILAQASQNDSDAAYLHQAGSYAYSMGKLSAAAGVAKGIASTSWGSFGVGNG